MQKDEERRSRTGVCISIYFKLNSIRIYYETLKALGYPKRISFMLDNEVQHLLVTTHDGLDCLSHIVPKKSYLNNGGMCIGSLPLCRIILSRNNFNPNCSYRFYGIVFEDQGIVKFDLSKGEIISHHNG